jgi:hypothetical protein
MLPMVEGLGVLGALPAKPVRLARPHAAAEKVRVGFAQRHVKPAFREMDRGCQAREAASDYDNS